MPVFGLPTGTYGTAGVDAGRLSSGGPLEKPTLSLPGKEIGTVFVLGGGGVRGALQVGMLRALCERGIVADLLVGTSIGAVNAVAFAGEPTIEGVYLAAHIWQRIGTSDVFPRSRFHGSWRYFERREAVFPNDGLRRIVTGVLRFDRLEDSPIPVVVVATRLEDATEEWISHGPAADAVLASAALPGLYPAVELHGSHYIDGGVLDNVPISAALAAGPKRVFVLLCSGTQMTAPHVDRPYEALLAAFSINLHGRLRRDLAAVPPGVDVVVFDEPDLPHTGIDDLSKTTELIERGYLSARRVLDEYLAAVGARTEPPGRLRRARPSRRSTPPAR
ncbi:MAG: patatin-like phospholipase family protein [Acidimicrobiales bacterium]